MSEEAIDFFNKAIQIQPYYADAHNNLGTALSGLGKIIEAINSYKEAIKLQPDYIKALINFY